MGTMGPTSIVRRVSTAFASLALLAVPALAQPAPGQNEFVPLKDLGQVEPLPAAPLLVAAYAFVWVAVLFFVWTVWRRLGKVESEMRALEPRARRGGQ